MDGRVLVAFLRTVAQVSFSAFSCPNLVLWRCESINWNKTAEVRLVAFAFEHSLCRKDLRPSRRCTIALSSFCFALDQSNSAIMISVATFRLPGSALRRYPSQVMMSFTTLQQRNYKSTQAVERPEEESHFLLILGPPGGGKGTISKKMLKVRRLIGWTRHRPARI
jgi:hypothetical protein